MCDTLSVHEWRHGTTCMHIHMTSRHLQYLLVLSVGMGQFDRAYNYEKVTRWGASQWDKRIVKIVGAVISDIVDQAISMAFGQSRRNYFRIQGNGLTDKCVGDTDDPSKENMKIPMNFADSMLK